MYKSRFTKIVVLFCAMIVFIKENSPLAKIAARKLHSRAAAIVVNKTIYLWGASREEFLQSPSWVRHEVAHVNQYKKWKLLPFIVLYLYQTLRNGYNNNRFEMEARREENNPEILNNILFR
ncbi:MAG: DUF4157 domain-containing protein [Bacteroidota bacterium]|nr:DUF4157 domain-containing protein [Bacteroidota bacterium]